MYHYDDNSLNKVFKTKFVKPSSSSLLQLNKKLFKCNNNRRLDSSWTKQIPKYLYEVPGTSKDLKVWYRR